MEGSGRGRCALPYVESVCLSPGVSTASLHPAWKAHLSKRHSPPMPMLRCTRDLFCGLCHPRAVVVIYSCPGALCQYRWRPSPGIALLSELGKANSLAWAQNISHGLVLMKGKQICEARGRRTLAPTGVLHTDLGQSPALRYK